MTLRALVADDEPLARETVRRLDGVGDIELRRETADGRQAVDAIRGFRPDLVFLDVQMPHLDGFGVVEAVGPEAMPATVFTTAFDGHALRAFDAAAVDWAEAAGDYVALHAGPQTHLLRETLTGLEERLDGRRFLRIHRSAIVQVDRVRDVKLTAAGDAKVRRRDGTEVRASRRYWRGLEARLGGAA
jgi:two-component system LytT family response regulator